MKLTLEEMTALHRAVESYELPENYGQEWTAFIYAAGIAQERARCAKVCRDLAASTSEIAEIPYLRCAVAIERDSTP